jgi:RNA polymerase sigma-70 factor (ECF subfamily)
MADDQDALEKIRQGGQARTEGVSQLYRSYARRFLSYFMKHRVPREQAEDLAQDVFVSIVRHAESFRGETRIDAWMWAIARNALIDHFRRARPEDPFEEDDLVRIAEAQADAPREAGGGLEDCEGWSIEDVAAVLKRTPGATREYLSQCRKKLKAFLQPCRDYLAG